MCVAWICWRLGRVTEIPCWVGRSLMHGLVIVKKWPVHPVSAMATEGGVQLGLEWVTLELLGVMALVLLVIGLAAPMSHMVILLRPASLPPMELVLVALLWCPGAGLRQLVLSCLGSMSQPCVQQ